MEIVALGIGSIAGTFVIIFGGKALIDQAKREDRDLTDEEVEGFFAETDAVAERVEDALVDLENEEAGGGSDSGAVTEDDS